MGIEEDGIGGKAGGEGGSSLGEDGEEGVPKFSAGGLQKASDHAGGSGVGHAGTEEVKVEFLSRPVADGSNPFPDVESHEAEGLEANMKRKSEGNIARGMLGTRKAANIFRSKRTMFIPRDVSFREEDGSESEGGDGDGD